MSQELNVISARDLTPEEQQERIDHVFAIEQRIKRAAAAGRTAMWALAEALHEFDEESGWTALGYEKKADWLADPDISMSRGTYDNLLRAWRKFALRGEVKAEELSKLDVSKVVIVLPSVEAGKTTIKNAIKDVESMGARDLREQYIQAPAKAKVKAKAKAGDPPAASAIPDTSDYYGDSDVEGFVPPPINDGTDTPKLASDVTVEEVTQPAAAVLALDEAELKLLLKGLDRLGDPRRKPKPEVLALRKKVADALAAA